MSIEHGSGMDNQQTPQFGADTSVQGFQSDSQQNESNGSSIQEEEIQKALDSALDLNPVREQNSSSNSSSETSVGSDVEQSLESTDNEGSQSEEAGSPEPEFNRVSSDQISNAQSLDPARIEEETNLADRLDDRGDVLDGGGGTNTVIGAGGNDIILGNTPEAFNTITTGTGEDLIVLGGETTNRVFDFDPANDKFGLDSFNIEDILFGQGTNPDNGGLDQPLDSDNNTVIIDRNTDQILASLTFTNAGDLSEDNFVTVRPEDLNVLQG